MAADAEILEAWDLIFKELRYYQLRGITGDEFRERLSALINFTSLSYQNNPDVVEYIPMLTQDVAGKYYSVLRRCADYLSGGATINREKLVTFHTTRSIDGTTAFARLCKDGDVNGSLYDYVNYKGSGHHCKVIFDYNSGSGATPGNITRKVRFKDMSIFFGAGITAHDRILGDMIFDNCKLYFYRNVVLTNTEIKNTVVLLNTDITMSVNEDSILNNSAYNKNLTIDTPVQQIGVNDYNYVETMPDDPTTEME